MGHGWLGIIILALIVSACSEVDLSKVSDEDMERISDKLIVCNKPYIRFGASCCLDRNENAICDQDETSNAITEESNSTPTPTVTELMPINGDMIIVNSRDWRDAYTGLQYASLLETRSQFILSEQHAQSALYSIPTENKIVVLSSKSEPFTTRYVDILQRRGHTGSQELISDNLNLELLKRVDTTRFIIVDDTYGYDAISVAPYATTDRAFVVFANRDTMSEVAGALMMKNVEHILIYGEVDPEVRTSLSAYNPETLDKGSRFDNNIEITKRYMQLRPTKQVILTNGEFIEASIMSGQDPVVFLGRQNVPESVRTFIRESDVEVGILIGNELANVSTFVRRQLGISVFVKFAQGSGGQISKPVNLDSFPTPTYNCTLNIESLAYSRAASSVDVTYTNRGTTDCAFKSTLTLTDISDIKVTGDETPIILPAGTQKTTRYSKTSDEQPISFDNTFRADIFVIYGKDAGSLENVDQKSVSVEIA